MSYIHPEREEFLPDAVLRCTSLPTPHVDPPADEVPPWTRPVHPDYSWGDDRIPLSRLRTDSYVDVDYSWDPDTHPPVSLGTTPATPEPSAPARTVVPQQSRAVA